MATPPVLVAFSEADSGNVAAANKASATLTWSIGDVLVAFGMSEGGGAGDTMSISNTGSGLSWGSPQQLYSNASDTPQYCWACKATANSSGIVTVAHTRTTDRLAIGVGQARAPSGATIAIGNSKLGTGLGASPQRVSLTMSSPDSMVFWGAGDWSAAAGETVAPASSVHSVSAPGPSALPSGGAPVGTSYTWYLDELDDETVGSGSVFFGYTGSSAGPFTIIAIEITVSGGAAAIPSPAYLPRNITGRGVRNLRSMRRYEYTRTPVLATGVTFTDAVTGALIFGGTVEEGWTWAFPNQRHARRLPIARGLRDLAGLRGYPRTPSTLAYAAVYTDAATGTWIFGGSAVEAKRGTDARSGAWIFAGSRVEAKRGTDARSGALIFGGTRAEAITFVQARSGSLIFGGARTELKRGTDAQAGSVIFGGGRTELKRYGDVRSGAVIFGGSATQLRVGTDARTGTIIFGGHSSTVTASASPVRVTFIIPDARGRRRRTRW